MTQNWQEGGTREDQYQKEMLDEEQALQVPLRKTQPCPSKIRNGFQTNLGLQEILFAFKRYLVINHFSTPDPQPPNPRPSTLNPKPHTPNPKPQPQVLNPHPEILNANPKF